MVMAQVLINGKESHGPNIKEGMIHKDQEWHPGWGPTVEEVVKIYTDQARKRLMKSSQGKNYFFIMYAYTFNTIIAEPIKNKFLPEIVWVFSKLY